MPTNSKSAAPQIDQINEALNASLNVMRTLLLRFFSTKKPANPARTPRYKLIEHGCTDRAVAERFIAQRFADSFDARVDAFMPRLFTAQDPDGTICGAFGLRSAQRKLFIEQYLQQPIERAIAPLAGTAVERHRIIEVGHFSGAFPGAMRTLILLLIERLRRENFDWVVFTGTLQLRNAFHRMGLFPVDIGAATIESIPLDTRPAWGCYHEQAPRVLASRISNGALAFGYGKQRASIGRSRT